MPADTFTPETWAAMRAGFREDCFARWTDAERRTFTYEGVTQDDEFGNRCAAPSDQFCPVCQPVDYSRQLAVSRGWRPAPLPTVAPTTAQQRAANLAPTIQFPTLSFLGNNRLA